MSQQMYSTQELEAMTPEELREAQSRGFVKPNPNLGPNYTPQWEQPDTAPTPAPQASEADNNPYAPTAWGTNTYDFRTPSGQLCQMKKMRPEEMISTGLLDRITRLPALAEEQVQQASGQPPKPDSINAEDLRAVVEVLDVLLPMVVVQPRVYPRLADEADREPGRVYVNDIELADRIAIMERATAGVKKMDNFRAES